MESVDIQNWEVVKSYDRNGCKVRIYQGTDDDGIIVYRYEVEEPSGYIEDPAEPFPFYTQEECESTANEDADHYENEGDRMDDKVEAVAQLIEQGFDAGVGSNNFDLEITGEGTQGAMDETDREHIANLVREGYTNGEVLPKDENGDVVNRGWWKIDLNANEGTN